MSDHALVRCSAVLNALVRSSAARQASASRANGISPVPAEGLEGPLRSIFVASWKGSGRCESPNVFQTIAHPAAWTEQLGHLCQGHVLVQPVESGGTKAEIKASLAQHGFFKRGNDHRERLVPEGLPKKRREAIIRLDG